MMAILFRSKLTPAAGEYYRMEAAEVAWTSDFVRPGDAAPALRPLA